MLGRFLFGFLFGGAHVDRRRLDNDWFGALFRGEIADRNERLWIAFRLPSDLRSIIVFGLHLLDDLGKTFLLADTKQAGNLHRRRFRDRKSTRLNSSH